MAGLPYAEAVQKFNGLVSVSRSAPRLHEFQCLVYSKNGCGVAFEHLYPRRPARYPACAITEFRRVWLDVW